MAAPSSHELLYAVQSPCRANNGCARRVGCCSLWLTLIRAMPCPARVWQSRAPGTGQGGRGPGKPRKSWISFSKSCGHPGGASESQLLAARSPAVVGSCWNPCSRCVAPPVEQPGLPCSRSLYRGREKMAEALDRAHAESSVKTSLIMPTKLRIPKTRK